MGRGRDLVAFLSTAWRRTTVAAAMTIAAYGLVLIAVQRAPVGYVAALRESSVLIAVFVGSRISAKAAAEARLIAAGLIVGGLVLLVDLALTHCVHVGRSQTRACRRGRLLGGFGSHLVEVDPCRAAVVEQHFAFAAHHSDGPDAWRERHVPCRVDVVVRPFDRVVGAPPAPARSPASNHDHAVSGEAEHVVGAVGDVRQPELLQHVGADPVGAEHDRVRLRSAGRA